MHVLNLLPPCSESVWCDPNLICIMVTGCKTCNACVLSVCTGPRACDDSAAWLTFCILPVSRVGPEQQSKAAFACNTLGPCISASTVLHACRPGTPAWWRSGRPLRRAKQRTMLSSGQRERPRLHRSRPSQGAWQLHLLRAHREQHRASQRANLIQCNGVHAHGRRTSEHKRSQVTTKPA